MKPRLRRIGAMPAKLNNASPSVHSQPLLLTTVLSVASGIIGVVAGQGLEFLKTRELRREEQRARIEEKVWTETQQSYRKLFGMRTRLPTDVVNYRFAVIQKHYSAARANLNPKISS